MLKMGLIFLAVIAGCTGGTSSVDITEAEVAFAHSIRVEFADGSRMYAGEVQRLSNSSAQVEWWWVPHATSRGRSFDVRMFPAGGGKAVRFDPVVMDNTSRSSPTRIRLRLKNTALDAAHAHWVSVRLMDEEGGKIAAAHFPGSWVSIGAVAGVGTDPADHAFDRSQRMTLAFGGDANLGRRQNGITRNQGPDDALGALTALSEADLSIVNLECVLADGGVTAVDKDERVPFYFRGRPEQVQILTQAGIDAVGTANNHSGDYGADALMEQREILRSAGIAAPGAGPDRHKACAPAFVQRGGLTIGIVSADATLSAFAATEDAPGTCHVSSDDLPGAMDVLGPSIVTARENADVVLVAMHWGRNGKSRPTKATRRLGAALIRGGADAVLGSSAHHLQGVELVDGRPILYDAGNILFDSHSEGELTRSGLFELTFDQSGVHAVSLRPIDIGYGKSRYASGNSAARTLGRFRDLSTELGTRVRVRDGVAEIGLPPPPERTLKALPPPPAAQIKVAEPSRQPPAGCVVESVPPEAAIEPVQWGPIELLGVRMDSHDVSERRTAWVETWWRVSEPVYTDAWMYQRVKSSPHRPEFMWWADHEHCDWGWPTSRWKPGEIVRDVYGLRPPKAAEPGKYSLVIDLIVNGERLNNSVTVHTFEYL